MSDILLEESISKILDECWTRIARDADYIYFPQILDLFEKFQMRILSTTSSPPNCNIFNTEEGQTIIQMSEANPRLKFYHGELWGFILKLSGAPSIARLLSDRLQLSKFDILKQLDIERTTNSLLPDISKFSSDGLQESGSIRERTRLFSRVSSGGMSSRGPVSPPGSLEGKSDLRLQYKIVDLELEVLKLQRQLKAYERNSSAPASAKIEDLLSQIEQKDIIILNFEKMDRVEHDEIFRRLTNAIEKQDTLIQSLKEKLSLSSGEKGGESTDDRNTLKTFIRRLPFAKQYYVYYKEQKNLTWRSIIINIGELVLTTAVLLNFMKFVLYIVIFAFTYTRSDDFGSYINEDGGNLNYNDSVTLEWWKEIEWLEYYIYKFTDYIT